MNYDNWIDIENRNLRDRIRGILKTVLIRDASLVYWMSIAEYFTQE